MPETGTPDDRPSDATALPRSLADRKVDLRRRLRTALRALSDTHRRDGGVRVARHLEPRFERLARADPGSVVALFASLPYEIDTGPVDDRLRALGLRRILPAYRTGLLVFHEVAKDASLTDLPRDRMGIPTPPEDFPVVPLEHAALIVVPGLAFDSRGTRLGQGGGYYDRALGALPQEPATRPASVGIGLDLQCVETLPRGPFDVPVAWLCSPDAGLRKVDDGSRTSAGAP